jgi:hypothetical protein
MAFPFCGCFGGLWARKNNTAKHLHKQPVFSVVDSMYNQMADKSGVSQAEKRVESDAFGELEVSHSLQIFYSV